MDISEAIDQRKSIRAFKPDPVSKDTLKKILEEATRAPSWANTQPWEFAIATGKPLEEIRAAFLEKFLASPNPDVPRPPEFPRRYADRIRVLDKQNRLVTPKDWESRRIQNFKHYGADGGSTGKKLVEEEYQGTLMEVGMIHPPSFLPSLSSFFSNIRVFS